MQSRIALLLVFVLSAATFAAEKQNDDAAALQRVRNKVDELSHGRTEQETLKEIAAWKQREPGSPEPYVVAANYYLKRTIQPIQVTINSTEGQKAARRKGKAVSGQFSIVDPKTGKEVGVMGEEATGPKPDAQTVQKLRTAAANELGEALKIAASRLDIMLGRALVLHDAHDWKLFTSQMEVALQRVASDPQNLIWLENKPPPRPAKEEVVRSLHSKIMEAFEEQSPTGDQRGEELATLGAKYLPDAVEFVTDCGTARAYAKDWAGAAKLYERASQLAPEDSIVLGNLARAYLNLGDRAKTEATARKVIELNKDPGAVENARDILETLSKKPGKSRH